MPGRSPGCSKATAAGPGVCTATAGRPTAVAAPTASGRAAAISVAAIPAVTVFAAAPRRPSRDRRSLGWRRRVRCRRDQQGSGRGYQGRLELVGSGGPRRRARARGRPKARAGWSRGRSRRWGKRGQRRRSAGPWQREGSGAWRRGLSATGCRTAWALGAEMVEGGAADNARPCFFLAFLGVSRSVALSRWARVGGQAGQPGPGRAARLGPGWGRGRGGRAGRRRRQWRRRWRGGSDREGAWDDLCGR